jgi:tRNA A37 threonylcarbamoyladenosine synthetase subunit TsaC/SUA5/YrdC
LLATFSTNAAGAQQLLKIAKSIGGQALLCLSHPDQLPDFVEPLSSQALRLAHRGWPGPIILEFVQSGRDRPLMRPW